MGLFLERIKYEALKLGSKSTFELTKSENDIANEVLKTGYSFIPNFCDSALLDSLIASVKDHFSSPKPEFSYKGDTRHYGIERKLSEIEYFSESTMLRNIGNRVMSRPICTLFTLGNHLIAGNNGSSGGGWHRDSMQPQFKALMYLTNVNDSNGPLQIIPGTHKFTTLMKLQNLGLLKYNQQWLEDGEIEAIEKYLKCPRITVTGKAGTLVVFKSNTLHRGKPIKIGERIALTNYYYPTNSKFEPILKNFGISNN